MKAVGDDGEPSRNPVCKAVLGFIAGGKTGGEIRSHFEAPPYGWSRDAVDGGLQVLLVAGLVRAQDDHGRAVNPQDLERRSIGKTTFKVESTTVTTPQRIQVRKLLQRVGCQAKQGEELSQVPMFLRKMEELADRAGGEPPRPPRPETRSLEDIRLTGGNEQLLAIYNQREELGGAFDQWTDLATRIEKRMPGWHTLQRLAKHASGLREADVILPQVRSIREQRPVRLSEMGLE